MTVQKAKADTEPSVIDYGNGTVVVVVGDNATGNVTIKVGDHEYNATVVNGTAVVTIDNETPGTHEVEVIYSGDGNHTNSTITTGNRCYRNCNCLGKRHRPSNQLNNS